MLSRADQNDNYDEIAILRDTCARRDAHLIRSEANNFGLIGVRVSERNKNESTSDNNNKFIWLLSVNV